MGTDTDTARRQERIILGFIENFMFYNELRRRRSSSSIAVSTVCERQKKGNMAVEFDQSIE